MKISGMNVLNRQELAKLQGGKAGGHDPRITRPDIDLTNVSVTRVQAIRPACC